jgi:predicted acylesterase/phospholipase RssA
MTGSFPVAFEPQKWKTEWGKYYIHYKNTRKEVDLTEAPFTDGGMLANFPVKFIDN